MAEQNVTRSGRRFRAYHRGRISQIGIYFGKMLRMFVYQNDWKVLPMAALIAGLVGMVIRNRLFINMEGTLMGAFAMVMVCIWNGCFNSIQVVCRERDVIKREHRSGMHISSYIVSHMMYQAILCLLQTGVTLYVTKLVGVKYPAQGLVTPWMIVDFGISMFLITYASDMMSLWVSTLARTTTTAMTIMPFVLIFQLVFSGGMLTLPEWSKPLTNFTISNPGLKVLTAQGDYNARPVVTLWKQVDKMREKELSATVTLGQVLDVLGDADNPVVAEIREREIGKVMTVQEIFDAVEGSASYEEFKGTHVLDDLTVGDVLKFVSEDEQFQALRDQDFGLPGFTVGKLLNDAVKSDKFAEIMDKQVSQVRTVGDIVDAIRASGLLEKYGDVEIGGVTTVGEAVDMLAGNADVQAHREDGYTFKSTVGSIIDMIGEEKVKDILQNRIRDASYDATYDYTIENVVEYWFRLLLFVLAFAALSTITLEFIDKDKR